MLSHSWVSSCCSSPQPKRDTHEENWCFFERLFSCSLLNLLRGLVCLLSFCPSTRKGSKKVKHSLHFLITLQERKTAFEVSQKEWRNMRETWCSPSFERIPLQKNAQLMYMNGLMFDQVNYKLLFFSLVHKNFQGWRTSPPEAGKTRVWIDLNRFSFAQCTIKTLTNLIFCFMRVPPPTTKRSWSKLWKIRCRNKAGAGYCQLPWALSFVISKTIIERHIQIQTELLGEGGLWKTQSWVVFDFCPTYASISEKIGWPSSCMHRANI